MFEINELNHVPVVISSLDKIYNKAKVNGKLNSINLYVFNIIFKLLNLESLTLTDTQIQKLKTFYSNIYFNSQDICKTKGFSPYTLPVKNKFFQAETTDCNTYPKFENIYYWQEEDLNTTYSNILAIANETNYLNNKKYYSYSEFNNGKLLEYNNIGRICFMAVSSNNVTLNIIDILGNNVNDAFDVHYYEDVNSTLFVSKNIFSYGPINFKITKS